MKNKLTILIATDFTEAANHAVDYTLNLFKSWKDVKINFLLVHSYKPMAPYGDAPSIPVIQNQELGKEYSEKLEALSETIKNKAGVKTGIKTFFEAGPLNVTIKKIMRDEHPDLVVMGSREMSTFERMTFGSNTIEVASTVDCPVLAVPLEAEIKNPENIVFAVDSEPMDIPYEDLGLLKNLKKISNANLKVVHVAKSGDKETLRKAMEDTVLHRYISEVAHAHHPIVNENIFEGILSFVEQEQPGLLVAVPRERNFFEKIFHTSITGKMVHHTKVPILLLNYIK